MNNEDLVIYVITHKKYNLLNNGIYTPLFVGANGKKTFNYLRDDMGDNISEKNPYYNELTGLYWMWKNSNANIIGLVHYRRYFINHIWGNFLNKNDIIKYLNKYDIIIAKHTSFNEGSLYKYFNNEKEINVTFENLPILKGILEKLYPGYVSSFEIYLNKNIFYPFSMFITSKQILNEYCVWLFNILDEFENKVGLHPYGNHNYKKRVFGILAEFLFGVWLTKNSLKIKECYVYRVESKSNLASIVDENFLHRKFSSNKKFALLAKKSK